MEDEPPEETVRMASRSTPVVGEPRRNLSKKERQNSVLLCLLEVHPEGLTRAQLKERTWLSSQDLDNTTNGARSAEWITESDGRYLLTEIGHERACKIMAAES